MELTFNELPKAVTNLQESVNNIERLLLEKSNQDHLQPDQLLTIQQAGMLLNLSVPTIYGYVQRAEIPVSKRKKRLYFSKQELIDWIKAGRKKTISEIKLDAEQYITNKKK